MSGIYVHIPFCKTKCWYCDFYSVTKTGGRAEFSGLLLDELAFRDDYLSGRRVETIYFGGGTPTLLSPGELQKILAELFSRYDVAADAEITLEANPDDLAPELVREFRAAGFNRISIGVQSFFDAHLKMMNRRHDAGQAIEAVNMAHEQGFRNISLDLIYGIPGMTPDQWEHNLRVASALPAGHISAYHLTIEPDTRFGRLKKAGLFTEIADEESVGQYGMLLDILGGSGFEQYEISNFARNGQYSRHNTKYWTGDSYLGLGPSAHSFNGTQRHWNPPSLVKYALAVRERKAPAGETVDALMHRNEFVMTRLRTAKGILGTDFQAEFGDSEWEELLSMARKPLLAGYLILENGRLYFDRNAWFRSDGILSDLFRVR